MRTINHWNNLPRDMVGSPSLAVLYRMLGNLTWAPFSHQRLYLVVYKGPFQPGLFYDAMIIVCEEEF